MKTRALLLTLFTVILSITALAQAPTRAQLMKVNQRYMWESGGFSNVSYLPLDTAVGAEVGAKAYKNGIEYTKDTLRWRPTASGGTFVGDNMANKNLDLTADRTHNGKGYYFKLDTLAYLQYMVYRNDPFLGNKYYSQFYLDSTINGFPFRFISALRNWNNTGDSIHTQFVANQDGTTIYNYGLNGNRFGLFEFKGNAAIPQFNTLLYDGTKQGQYTFGAGTAYLAPQDSFRLKLPDASGAPGTKMMVLQSGVGGVYTPAVSDMGNFITGLTGDVTATGPGVAVATLPNTGVIPGTYTNLNATIDAKGRITSATNGTGGIGSSDTTNKWVNDIKRSNDSVYVFKNGTYQFRYKDSTGTTAQNIQQVLDVGDTSRRPINYKYEADSTGSMYTWKVTPSNYGIDYGAEGIQWGYSAGWHRGNGVNASGRPNIVLNIAQYNMSNGGGRINGSDAAYRFGLETHFNTGGQRLFEFHLPEMTTYSGAMFRPFTMYMNKETGATQFNYYATGGVDYQNTSGQGLLAFGGLGGLNVFGRPGNLSLTLQDDDLFTYRTLMLEGGGVQHLSYGQYQYFDSHTTFNNAWDNSTVLTITDNRNATANTVGLSYESSGTNQPKVPIQIQGNTTGGMENQFENGTGSMRQTIRSGVEPSVSILNTNPSDPLGTGYNTAYIAVGAGNGSTAGSFGAYHGQSNLGNIDSSILLINTTGVGFGLSINALEKMRMSRSGQWLIGRKSAVGSELLSVNGSAVVADDAYNASSWNGNFEVPTKNAIRDKIESMGGGITSINGHTGSAITIQGGTALSVDNSTPDFVTFNVTPNSSALPHTLDAVYTTAGNTGTGETDLFTYTLPAGELAIDGRTMNFEIDGEFNDNTITAQLRLYFAGNVTLNTGAVSVSTAFSKWRIKGYIMRTSSSTAHVTYEMHAPGLATPVFLSYNNLTSLDFTTTNVFKISAQAAGGGAGNSDITAHSWQLLYKPQPQ